MPDISGARKSLSFKYSPFLWTTILTTGVVAVLLYSLVSSHRMATNYFPLADAAMQIQLEATLGHLWLEEMLSGVRDEDISSVWDHLDNAEHFAQTMDSGDSTREKMVLLLRDPALKLEIEKVTIKLEAFRSAAEMRWKDYESSGVAAPHDKKFESLFVELMDQTNIVEDAVKKARASDFQKFQIVQGGMIIVVLGFSLFSWLIFRRLGQKQAQIHLALTEGEHRTRSTFNALSDAVFIHPFLEGGFGSFVDVNQTACEMYGYTPKEFLCLSASNISRKADVDSRAQPDYRKLLMEQGQLIFETMHITKQGVEFPVEINSTIIELEGKQMIMSVVRDISDRKKTEDLLRESKAHYEALFDDSPVALWEEDFNDFLQFWEELKKSGISDFRLYLAENPHVLAECTQKIEIKKVNKAAIALHDADSEEQLLSNLDKVFCEKSYEIFKEELIAITEGHLEFEAEAEIKTLSGETKNVFLKLTMDPKGLGAGKVLLATWDITENAKLGAQLRQAQKMESVGLLAGGVAHDFNNMLAVILGNTELALDEVNEHQPIYGMLEGIKRAGTRSADLTKQLLAFARKQTIAPRLLDLNIVVDELLKMMRRLIGENIELNWLPGDLPQCIKMDPSQLDQILTNLCVNSRDAIDGIGKITIETKTAILDEDYCAHHPGFRPGQYALLVVSDDGCGMSQDILDRIYEPFFSTKASGEGSGLGLATVYGIVKQNLGFINVFSEVGTGTSINIYLPYHEGKASNLQSGETVVSHARGTETILLVEDEESLLEMTHRMLEKHGYTVMAASTPEKALRLAGNHSGEIHLLLSDVVMPVMSGVDLSAQLKTSLPDLKYIFMSGYTADVIARDGVLDESVNFLQKPFTMEELLGKVKKALEPS